MSKRPIKIIADLLWVAVLLALAISLTGLFIDNGAVRLFVVLVTVFLVGLFGGLPSHWRNPMEDGWPTYFYRSRSNAPWDFPREVSDTGSRQARADFRVLNRRLMKISDLPFDPGRDWLEATLLRDPVSGQHWRRELHERGLNQYFVLVPVSAPDAHDSVDAIRRDPSDPTNNGYQE